MRTIWKFPLAITNVQDVEMPEGAQILTVLEQDGLLYLWAEIDSTARKEKRRFVIFGIGHPISGAIRTYVGTAQVGSFVWHVFEEIRGDIK